MDNTGDFYSLDSSSILLRRTRHQVKCARTKMQFWIFFGAGVGGDGFANLLEHANNVTPADGETSWRVHHGTGWRIHHGTAEVKFYGAKWTTDPIPFRNPRANSDQVVISPEYVRLINQKQNIVLCAHTESYRSQIDTSQFKELVQKDQVKIHLYSMDTDRIRSDLIAKFPGIEIPNNWQNDMIKSTNQELARTDYALHIDIEQVWQDWEYLDSCLTGIGIDLDKVYYDKYLNIINKTARMM